eukprot:1159412-Pelagomonas_calceolata.AAC.2
MFQIRQEAFSRGMRNQTPSSSNHKGTPCPWPDARCNPYGKILQVSRLQAGANPKITLRCKPLTR